MIELEKLIEQIANGELDTKASLRAAIKTLIDKRETDLRKSYRDSILQGIVTVNDDFVTVRLTTDLARYMLGEQALEALSDKHSSKEDI